MKRFLPLVAGLFGIIIVAGDPGCPSGYSSILNRTCYRVFSTPKHQADANIHCHSFGGYLSSVHDAFTNTFLYDLASRANAHSVWLGIECSEANKESCRNVDESLFGSFAAFPAGQPSSVGTCVYMSVVGRDTQHWYSHECRQPFAFACEVDYDLDCMPGYIKNRGNCYKVASASGETDAELDCQKDCGHLVSIHSFRENQYVTNLAVANITDTYGIVRIGLKAQMNYGTSTLDLKWTDGSAVDYSFIEYNNTDLGLCYGLSLVDRIVYQGYWISVNCDTKMPYMCKTGTGFCHNNVTTVAVTPATCYGAQHYHGVGEIYSPGFPGAYIANGFCQYCITSPVGTVVEVYFSVQSLEGGASVQLFEDISYTHPFTVITNATPFDSRAYKSSENQMTVIFSAPNSSQNGKWVLNFRPTVPTYPNFVLPQTTTTLATTHSTTESSALAEAHISSFILVLCFYILFCFCC